MNRKILAIIPILLTLTACAGGYSEQEESISETVSEVSESAESVSETVSEVSEQEESVSESVSEVSESEESVSETSEQTETVSETSSETEMTLPSAEQTESETAAVSFTESEESSWKSLYKEKLAEISQSEEFDPLLSPGFELYDVDSDGVPELFVSIANYHAAGVMIFTMKDGECISLKNTAASDEFDEHFYFGSFGEAQAAKGGYIASCYAGMGSKFSDYFKLENGELTLIVSSERHLYFDEESDKEAETFLIDGNEVSEEDYSEAAGFLEKMKWTDVGRAYYSFDTDEIDEIFSQMK